MLVRENSFNQNAIVAIRGCIYLPLTKDGNFCGTQVPDFQKMRLRRSHLEGDYASTRDSRLDISDIRR